MKEENNNINNNGDNNAKIDIKKINEEVKMDDFEFVEEEKKEDLKKEEPKETKKINKFKDPEKIKNIMKSINIKTPDWAKNMNDSDFIAMAKKFISNKSKK